VEHDDLANYLGFAEVALYNVSASAMSGQGLTYRCTSTIIPKVGLLVPALCSQLTMIGDCLLQQDGRSCRCRRSFSASYTNELTDRIYGARTPSITTPSTKT
jgi:hypothetical protein